MTNERPPARIIPFPSRGRPRAYEQVVPAMEDVPVLPWPPVALDALEGVGDEPVRWLEEALIAAKVRELTFLRALAQIPITTLRPEMQRGPLAQFHEVAHRLTLALELLRLGQVGPAEVRALVPGLRRAWSILRDLRQSLLDDLEPRARASIQAEEARSVVGSLDVERELQERSHRRTVKEDPYSRKMVAPGPFLLDMPDRPEIELRRRRERRLCQDNRQVNVEMDLAGWLEDIPKEWLEGVARSIGLPLSDDRWEQERAVRSRLTGLGGLRNVIAGLPPIERRILRQLVENGGMTRYDPLIIHYGGDDETAWHWAEEVPTTPLERVRRTGIVFVGQAQIGRRSHRVAVVPVDLREPLARRLDNP